MDNIDNNSNKKIYDVEMRKLDARENNLKSILSFYMANRGKIIGILLAFITLICLFKFGLFKTFGIWLVMLIGYIVGACFDKDIRVIRLLRKIFDRRYR